MSFVCTWTAGEFLGRFLAFGIFWMNFQETKATQSLRLKTPLRDQESRGLFTASTLWHQVSQDFIPPRIEYCFSGKCSWTMLTQW
jgi:hypothetical protein